MNLRKARIDDHWRRLFKRNYNSSLENISFTGEHLFSEFDSPICNGLTCIVGKNGIGKSTFIRSLHNAFHSEGSNRDVFNINTINNGELELSVKRQNTTIDLKTTIGEKIAENITEPITSFLFDPCSTIPTLQELISTQANFDEMLEGFQESILAQEEIHVINYLTGNNYREIALTVIEDEYEVFSSFPFFKVTTATSNYDSRNMGLGELSLFYFYWLINYVNKFEGDKILFIEEPESFIPPVAQEKLSNILAQAISEYGVSCILSTHSEHILKRVPRSNILIFRKIEDKLNSRVAADNFEHLKIIGLAAPKVGLLLFEDSAAILFFKTIIKYSKEFVPDSFYYHNSGSEGDIIMDLRRFPGKIDGFRIIGVFDGDCRSKKNDLPTLSLFTFLPSDLAPEEVIIDYIDKVDKSDIASLFNISTNELSIALDTINGSDHHDYFEVLAKELNIPFDYLFSKICDQWVKDPINQDAVNEFLRDFGLKLS